MSIHILHRIGMSIRVWLLNLAATMTEPINLLVFLCLDVVCSLVTNVVLTNVHFLTQFINNRIGRSVCSVCMHYINEQLYH